LQFKKGLRPPPLCLGWMERRMNDETNDETDGWKGPPPKDIIEVDITLDGKTFIEINDDHIFYINTLGAKNNS